MAKFKREFTAKKKEKWEKDGRGQGRFEEYKPWLMKPDVASDGRSHRFKGNVIQRKIEVFSDLEYNVFIIFESEKNIIDAREQYPLPIEETLAIAEQYGIAHPTDPVTGEYNVVTTDFVFTFLDRDGKYIDIAVAAKYTPDLGSMRTIEKLNIEKIYWTRHGVQWVIITEEQINKNLAYNIDAVRNVYHLERTKFLSKVNKDSLKLIIEDLKNALVGKVIIRTICDEYDEKYFLPKGSSITLARHLIATKQLMCDLESRMLDFDVLFEVNLGIRRSQVESI